MSIKSQFAEYRSKVRDANNYPDAPEWVRQKLLERLDALIALENSKDFEDEARFFRNAAVRSIKDQCGFECDAIIADIPRM